MSQTLVVLAAGLSTRYGGSKQLEPVGPQGEVLLDYAVFDAHRAGFSSVAFVIREELEGDFQEHIAARFAETIRVAYAYQELEDLPAGRALPANRVKPWGTAHAILATRNVVNEPFVVINADDFYGRSAYSSLYEFRSQIRVGNTPQYAMIGYGLLDTLSEHGGVSRGICQCTESGHLERIIEVKEIRRAGWEIGGITTTGDSIRLNGNEVVSMNIWALTPAIFPVLETQFAEFLETQGSDPNAEFLISSALHDQVSTGLSRLKVITARDRWFGMTFRADRLSVAREIASLVEHGVYPDDLTTWFEAYR